MCAGEGFEKDRVGQVLRTRQVDLAQVLVLDGIERILLYARLSMNINFNALSS